jgi:hypothetical protein
MGVKWWVAGHEAAKNKKEHVLDARYPVIIT